jgi:hypothetical protein
MALGQHKGNLKGVKLGGRADGADETTTSKRGNPACGSTRQDLKPSAEANKEEEGENSLQVNYCLACLDDERLYFLSCACLFPFLFPTRPDAILQQSLHLFVCPISFAFNCATRSCPGLYRWSPTLNPKP